MSVPSTGRRGLSIRHLMWWILIIALVLALIGAFGWLSSPFLVMAVGAIISGTISVLRQQKQAEQDSLLWLLAIATEKHMPIAVGVEAFADQWGGKGRQRALSVSTLLNLGLSLPDALDRVPDAVPESAGVLIRVGGETGLLGESLREAYEYEVKRPLSFWAIMEKIGYIVLLLAVIQSITGFILYFIIPKFEAIFKDFNVELPWVTIQVIKFNHYGVSYFGTPLALFTLFFFFAALVELILIIPRAIGLIRFSLTGLIISLVSMVLTWVFSQAHTTTILRSLALGVDGDQPIGDVLNILSKCYPSSLLKRRLSVAAERVSRGGDWIEALKLGKLIRGSDASVLSSAQRAGNLAWALRTVALTAERRAAYRLQAFAEMLFPFAMLMVGSFVFVSAIAYFSPLVNLIGRLSQ